MRVLPDGSFERTFVAHGTRAQEKENYTSTWTLLAHLNPDSSVYGEFNGFLVTASQEVVRYTGTGNGKMSADGSMTMRGTLTYLNPPGSYARFNGMAVVWEFEVDKDGNLVNRGWEWK
jgi:hypothetical protein